MPSPRSSITSHIATRKIADSLLRQRLGRRALDDWHGVTFGGAAVSYGSKRQHCISLSSTEAEIVAASHTAAE
eukprot:4215395-Pleurochrysis_carterae.AAC.1